MIKKALVSNINLNELPQKVKQFRTFYEKKSKQGYLIFKKTKGSISPKQVWNDLNQNFNGSSSPAIVKDDEIDKKLKTEKLKKFL
jgi:hypothetical protein